MSAAVQDVIDRALALSIEEQEVVLCKLQAQLYVPNKEIDEAWAREAEDRIAAYRAGEMEAYDADEVLAEFLVK